METLLSEAQRLDVSVKYARLAPPLRGAYIEPLRTIIISTTLTAAQQRETLAHELGHAVHGHLCSDPRTEAQAWRYAAKIAVDPDAYATAEHLNPHPAAIALELGLPTNLILEWQKHHGHNYERQRTP